MRSGYQATTINAIADRAEVSVPTVYLTFGSKAAILSSLLAGAGGDPDIRAVAAAARGETDPARKLQKAARVMRLILEREGQLTDLILQAGSGEAELVAAWRQMHGNRHRTLSEVFEPVLASRSPAAKRRAVDIAWAISSPEMYRLLVAEQRWTPVAFERWLATSLETVILKDEPINRSRG